MLLPDSSVWIDYLRGTQTQQTEFLDQALQQETVLIGDLILVEILQGVASEKKLIYLKLRLTNLNVSRWAAMSLQ